MVRAAKKKNKDANPGSNSKKLFIKKAKMKSLLQEFKRTVHITRGTMGKDGLKNCDIKKGRIDFIGAVQTIHGVPIRDWEHWMDTYNNKKEQAVKNVEERNRTGNSVELPDD